MVNEPYARARDSRKRIRPPPAGFRQGCLARSSGRSGLLASGCPPTPKLTQAAVGVAGRQTAAKAPCSRRTSRCATSARAKRATGRELAEFKRHIRRSIGNVCSRKAWSAWVPPRAAISESLCVGGNMPSGCFGPTPRQDQARILSSLSANVAAKKAGIVKALAGIPDGRNVLPVWPGEIAAPKRC